MTRYEIVLAAGATVITLLIACVVVTVILDCLFGPVGKDD